MYLHWFDRAFQSEQGPAKWAKAKLIRYADDFVIRCKKVTPRLESCHKLECRTDSFNNHDTIILLLSPAFVYRISISLGNSIIGPCNITDYVRVAPSWIISTLFFNFVVLAIGLANQKIHTSLTF